ncbi:MAG: hypothetical protein JWO98_2414 [Frankiales bacterium]|nr:hypothetical protein [Frankiales bacterium]
MQVRRTVVGLAVTIGAGAAVLSVAAFALSAKGPNATPLTAKITGTAETAQGTVPHAWLDLATYPDSLAGEHGASGGAHPDWVSYGPSTNLHVPAHALVTVTIRQYDSGGAVTNPYFAKAHGTVDGTVSIDGKTETQAAPDAMGHTFTIHAAPTNQDPLFVSVPLPAVADDAKTAPNSDYPAPHVVVFSFLTNGPGEYVWNCEYPCGDGYYAKFGGPMSTRGYMSGSLTVG